MDHVEPTLQGRRAVSLRDRKGRYGSQEHLFSAVNTSSSRRSRRIRRQRADDLAVLREPRASRQLHLVLQRIGEAEVDDAPG